MTPERELAEKIEEFRRWLNYQGEEWLSFTQVIRSKFSSLFPPPKPGAWCFFYGHKDRRLWSLETEEGANNVRAELLKADPYCNPGEVFFLPEEK